MAIIQKLFKIYTSNFNTIWGTCGCISVPKEKLNWFRDGAVISADVHTHFPLHKLYFYHKSMYFLLVYLSIYI